MHMIWQGNTSPTLAPSLFLLYFVIGPIYTCLENKANAYCYNIGPDILSYLWFEKTEESVKSTEKFRQAIKYI